MTYFHYLDPKTGLPIRVKSARRPSPGNAAREARRNNGYGPWLVEEFIGELHPAYATAHASNRNKWGIASLPEVGYAQLATLIYLGSVPV